MGRVWKRSLKNTPRTRGHWMGHPVWVCRQPAGAVAGLMASHGHAHVLVAAVALRSVLAETETQPNMLYFAG